MRQNRKLLKRILAVGMDTPEYQATPDTTESPGVTAETEPKGTKEIQVKNFESF